MTLCPDTPPTYDTVIPTNFLQRIANSNIQIIHDGVSSYHLSMIPYIFHPITIRNLETNQSRSQRYDSTLDVMRSRPGSTKISIWISKLLFPIQNISLSYFRIFKWEHASKHHYGFKCQPCTYNIIYGYPWNFIHSLINILPTKVQINIVLRKFYLENDYGNFFIVHVTHGETKMCVRGYALYSSLQDYTCSSTDDHRTLVDYAKLKGPPECWHLFFGNAKLQVPTKDLPHPTMNPFNLWSFSSVHVYMAVIAVKAGTNATICINKFGPRLFVELQIENDLRNDIESEFTQSFGFKFLSCYSEKYFSFDFYLAPFKLTLWLGLSITLAITCAIFQAYMFVKTGEVSFTVSLSFISLLLDDFTSVPESIANGLFYRLIFTVWGPVAVLIINCYGGLLVSELNAPLESVRPQTVEDLICKSRHLLDSRVVQNISSLAKELNFESYSAYWGNLDCSTPGFCLTPSSKIDYASNECFSILSPALGIYFMILEPTLRIVRQQSFFSQQRKVS